ncbi:Disease resistance protein L6 [Linum perenne]
MASGKARNFRVIEFPITWNVNITLPEPPDRGCLLFGLQLAEFPDPRVLQSSDGATERVFLFVYLSVSSFTLTVMKSESESSSSVDPILLPPPIGEYEVFLSFRGPDVRLNFADHLYTYLVGSKIRTFRDDEALPKGESIGPSLVKAITESKVYIPIFTQNYASSKWCLQELAKIVECWKTGGGAKGQHVILPVFYFIDSRDVRHSDSGSYKEAFELHSLKHAPETILEWKEAFQEVGKMKGWHVTELDGQGAVIEQIFSEVDIHLRANYTLVTDELVGIDFYVEEVTKLLNLDSASRNIVGIYGMGGLGKTTLAKAVYNKVSTQFERCIFLENTRDTLSNKDGTVTLQNKIISGILRKDFIEAKNASDGIRIIKERVCRHKLLIVLDDVDNRFQFDDILGKLANFSMDSRFIITTRDTRVLELLQGCKLFELEEMSHDHSLKLFSKHAFGVDYPPKDYASLSKEFVEVATGLPMYLKVIGSLLFKTDKRFWEDKLIELKEIPPTKVQERLRISYNELTHNEQQIFLDVACFFIGKYKQAPIFMWSDCNFYPTSTIRTLTQRSLVKIDHDNVIWMHDHVRDLGRAIVREEHDQSPYKNSRIWSNRDAVDMLKYKQGTDSIKAFRVDMKGENLVLRNKNFEKLSRLRYLDLYNARLSGNFKDVLPNIRWLRLCNCDSIPADLNLKKLVILRLEDCSVRDGWKGWNELKVARKLKVVSLHRCFNLRKVPDFSDCEGLEWLVFDECLKMLGELDIRNFKNLRGLGISKTKITKLKGEIGNLQNLRDFDASHTSLIEVPAGICKLSSLEFLDLTLTDPYKFDFTEMLPDNLKTLVISNASQKSLPNNFICKDLQRLPNLANLTNLLRLTLRDIGICEILGLGELKLLELLCIERAPNLVNLDGLENLVLLENLKVEGCLLLDKLPSLAALIRLHTLHIEECPVLTEICGVGELLESLLQLHVRACSSLTGMETLHSMVNLESLVLMGPELTSLSMFTKLRSLAVSGMSIEHFPDLSNLRNLRGLGILYCVKLIEVTGLDTLESLELLCVEGCWSIRNLPDLSRLVKLKKLNFSHCKALTEVRGLGKLKLLEELKMLGCQSIKELPDLYGLNFLRIFDIRKCVQLKEVNGIEELESLQVFEADKRLKVKYLLKSVSRCGKQLVTRSVRGATMERILFSVILAGFWGFFRLRKTTH